MNRYAYSILEKGNRRIELSVTFVNSSCGHSYVVDISTWRNGKFAKRLQKAFGKIEKADSLYSDIVLRLSVKNNYSLKFVTVS